MILESDNFVLSFPFSPHIQLMIIRAIKFLIFGVFNTTHPWLQASGPLQALSSLLHAPKQPILCLLRTKLFFLQYSFHNFLRWIFYPFCFIVTHLFGILPQPDAGSVSRKQSGFGIWDVGSCGSCPAEPQECNTNVPLTERTRVWQSAHHIEVLGVQLCCCCTSGEKVLSFNSTMESSYDTWDQAG